MANFIIVERYTLMYKGDVLDSVGFEAHRC